MAAAAAASPPTPKAFFAAVERAFNLACRDAGEKERFLRLGGFNVRLRFAGAALIEPMTRALGHLAAPPVAAPDLTVALWDLASTGVAPPTPPWSTDAYTWRSEVSGYSDDVVHTAFQLDTDSLLVFHAERGQALSWTRDATSLPRSEIASPMRSIFHWAARRWGQQLVHAGAVGRATGGVMLAGPGGSGKSSTALACLGSDLLYAGDDYCLLSLQPEPTVHSVYSSGKIHDDGLAALPLLAPHVVHRDPAGREKSILFPHETAPEAIVSSFPLRALVLPRVGSGRDSVLRPVSAATAVLALAPSTHSQLPNAGAELLRRLAELMRRTPCYELRLGSDRAQIPPLLGGLLDA